MTNTLNKYVVYLTKKAICDLDNIYHYIPSEILEPTIAIKQIDRIDEGISSLSMFPYSHQDRLVGKYANKGYKQFTVDNYIVIYRIVEEERKVIVVTIQYSKRNIW